MFKKKVKLEVPPELRIEIIHENFFNYLKLNKISQKKYSEDNNVPESTISKWKSCTSNMNEEHIFQAAKYFNVSVNMLYYTKQELKEINVLEVNDYNPIMAQQQKVIESIEHKVNETSALLFTSIIVVAIVGLAVSYFVYKYERWIVTLLIFIFPFLSKLIFNDMMVKKETLIINYLDQLYYKTSVKKNKYNSISVIFYCIQLLLILGLIGCGIYSIVDWGYNELAQIVLVCCVISFVLLLNCLGESQVNMKEKIYDTEIDDYNNAVVSFVFNLVLTVCAMPFILYFLFIPWLIAILLIIPILSCINVLLVAKKYSMYDLVLYDHKEDSERKLFNK